MPAKKFALAIVTPTLLMIAVTLCPAFADNTGAPSQAITSCDVSEMQRVADDIKYLDWREEAIICQSIANRQGTNPSTAVLRQMLKGVVAFSLQGDKDDHTEIAYQLLNLIEARGAKSDQAISGTLDTAFRLYETTQGHVTPKDLSVMLRSAGPMAHTLSDEGLANMGLVLWEEKKDRGE